MFDLSGYLDDSLRKLTLLGFVYEVLFFITGARVKKWD